MRGTKVIAALAALLGLALGLSFSGSARAVAWYFQSPASRMAADIDWLHQVVMWLIIVIFVVCFGAMFYACYAHRKSKGHKAEQFHENTTVELIWTVVPAIILVAIAWPATKVLIAQKDTSAPDITVKVTGYQWKWGYDYVKGEGRASASSHARHAARAIEARARARTTCSRSTTIGRAAARNPGTPPLPTWCLLWIPRSREAGRESPDSQGYLFRPATAPSAACTELVAMSPLHADRGARGSREDYGKWSSSKASTPSRRYVPTFPLQSWCAREKVYGRERRRLPPPTAGARRRPSSRRRDRRSCRSEEVQIDVFVTASEHSHAVVQAAQHTASPRDHVHAHSWATRRRRAAAELSRRK